MSPKSPQKIIWFLIPTIIFWGDKGDAGDMGDKGDILV
jgi:hypothetical protein